MKPRSPLADSTVEETVGMVPQGTQMGSAHMITPSLAESFWQMETEDQKDVSWEDNANSSTLGCVMIR